MVTLSPSGKAALDTFVARIIEEKKLPCVACGVSTDDEEIYFNCDGFNSMDDPSRGEVNKDSVFWICSQTKLVAHARSFQNLAALQLIEKGKLQVDTPVSTYLPVFENPIVLDDIRIKNPSFKAATKVVLVKHLLNFSSGLFYPVTAPLHVLPPAYLAPHDQEDPVGHFYNIIKGDLPSLPLKFEPGTDFAYGYSSDTLGFIVEKITGQTLEEYCHENIFKPLGMTSTSFYLTPELKAKGINLAFPVNGKLEPLVNQVKLIEQDPSRVKLHLGGTGLYSSMKDYLTLLRHLLQIKGKEEFFASSPSAISPTTLFLAGKTPPNSILSPRTVEEIFTPTLPSSAVTSLDFFLSFLGIPAGNQWSSALALRTEDWPGGYKKGSAFWSGWAGTLGHIDPETGVAVVFASQVVPSLDGAPFKLHNEFQGILYSNLQKSETLLKATPKHLGPKM
ncbi:beta-lactamase [Phlegmacium glaucopus]|nr:beta-lactamase [Phlegmacium glaucopus]